MSHLRAFLAALGCVAVAVGSAAWGQDDSEGRFEYRGGNEESGTGAFTPQGGGWQGGGWQGGGFQGGNWQGNPWQRRPQQHWGHQHYQPVPQKVYSNLPIHLAMPVDMTGHVAYALNGYKYTMQPGQAQQFVEDRDWVIRFHRGADYGWGTYSLTGGYYAFKRTDRGWELYRRSGGAPRAGEFSSGF